MNLDTMWDGDWRDDLVYKGWTANHLRDETLKRAEQMLGPNHTKEQRREIARYLLNHTKPPYKPFRILRRLALDDNNV